MERAYRSVMIEPNYPSPNPAHRRADVIVHAVGLILILAASSALLSATLGRLDLSAVISVAVYALAALASNVASSLYHFAPWHSHRVLLRRIDHAAIYPSITGTFTPFFVLAGTGWTTFLLVLSWALTFAAIWNKITNPVVKSKWSTASYLGLGAIGLCALPDLTSVPVATLWCILSGAAAYVIGTVFYTRRSLPYRYAIWHSCVNIGAVAMFAGVWIALFGL